MTAASVSAQPAGGRSYLGLLVGLGLAVVLFWLLAQPQVMPVRSVVLSGQFQYLDRDGLQRQLNVLRGSSFLMLDLPALRSRIEAENWVLSARIRRHWPDAIEVVLQERRPAALWGDSAMLGQDGVVMALTGDGRDGSLPRLDGPQGQERTVLAAHGRLVRRLEDLGLGLAALRMDARHYWQAWLVEGPELQFGRGDPAAQLERFVQVYPQLLAPRLAEIEVVDLRYANGLAVRWRNRPAAV